MARGKLESPNLDDRTWQDLVDQTRSLIPTYAPEWTDHNPSDLGMTLIELFAWLVEGMIYRLNRVPEKNFMEFLNLVGITRDPATPASTWLTYRSVPDSAPLIVPKGNQVATQQTETEEAVIFETDQDFTILPINLTTAVTLPEGGKVPTYKNITSQIITSPLAGRKWDLQAGEERMILLGFDADTAERFFLRCRFSKPLGVDENIAVSWHFSQDTTTPTSWPEISMVNDGTDSLRKNGLVSLLLTAVDRWTSQKPEEWSPPVQPRSPADRVEDSRFWLGIRIGNMTAETQPLGLEHILFNAVPATNALTIGEPELLGTSSGEPFQAFELANQPLFKTPASNTPFNHLVVEVREPQGGGTFGPWNEWMHQDDLPKGEGNYYRLEPVTGTITFGNFHAATSPQGHGTIPLPGSEIRALSYRYTVGGEKGNVPPDKISVIRTPLPNLVGATNPGRATGGSNEEAVEDTLRRGPDALRNRNRAVTVEDYEYLVLEATTDVMKVRCLPPRLFTTYEEDTLPPGAEVGTPWTFGNLDRSVGRVNVIIIPDIPDVSDAYLIHPTPEPSVELLQEVSAYLEARRMVTSLLTVTSPRYLPIRAHVTINVWEQAVDAGLVPDPNASTQYRDEIEAKIKQFLHPIRGQATQTGWEVGEDITISNLFEFIQPPAEVGFIASLEIEALTPLYEGGRPLDFPTHIRGVWVQLADYEIVCSAEKEDSVDAHAIVVNVT